MKKIMFNDRYGLTEAVLAGRKTMTRRTIHQKDLDEFIIDDTTRNFVAHHYAPYKIGEEVAVAQNYKVCWDIYQQRWEAVANPENWRTPDAILGDDVQSVKGWSNKMFVQASLMPHRIRITDIKVEHLQDITDEDCMKEGVEEEDFRGEYRWGFYTGFFVNARTGGQGSRSVWCNSPRKAYAALIDRISGKGTWQRNPWVFAYSFELIK